MNILHVIPGDLWAGAESQVYYTVKALDTFPELRITVIVFNRGELYKRLLNVGIDVMVLDENSMGSISICKRIKQELIVREVDIVHVHEYKSHILTALARMMLIGDQSVLFRTLHGMNVPNGIKSSCILGCQNIFLRYRTDHLIAVTGELKNRFTSISASTAVHLIYNAVDPGLLTAEAATSRIREMYGVSENTFWIGTAARLEPVKNLQLLVDAAACLRKISPELNFRVSIFGEGRLREELQATIKENDLIDHVFLEGHHNRIIPVLNALDVFTLTSLHEGLPMSLLEAMSLGTIPVCTAVGGIKEVISHGEDGFLVEPENAEKLADTFSRIAAGYIDVEQVRKNAEKKIRKEYSVEQNCRKLLSLYAEAL